MARRGTIAAAAVVVAAAAAVWWFHRHTQLDAVGPRFTEALLERRPGTTVDAWSGGVMRIALPSGVYLDLRLYRLFDACRADRFACSSAISAALDDVDQVDRATREPRRAMLGPTIVEARPPGYTLGYVTEPVIGRYELRFVLIHGLASTFVTSTIADRLGLSRAALKEAALGTQRTDDAAHLDALPHDAAVHAVRSTGDPAALLLDRERMRQFAATLGATRLVARLPARDTLYLAKADAAGMKAIAQAAPSGDDDLLIYDVDATGGAAISQAVPKP